MSSISCSICWDVILSGSVLATLKCGHIYHKDCIDEWIKQSKTCPDCRKKVGKPTRVYPNLETHNPNDLVRNADDLLTKNIDYQLKIVQLTKDLAEKDSKIFAKEELSQRLMDDFIELKRLICVQNQEAVVLNEKIASLKVCIELAESNIKIEKEMAEMANVKANKVIRELYDSRQQLKNLQSCAEFNDLALELKNLQSENHMQTIELSGRNKLIESLQRVNTELEASQHSLEMENKRLKIQTQAMEESTSYRPKAKRLKLSLTTNSQNVVDLTDDDQPITIIDDDDDDRSKESDHSQCVKTI